MASVTIIVESRPLGRVEVGDERDDPGRTFSFQMSERELAAGELADLRMLRDMLHEQLGKIGAVIDRAVAQREQLG